MNPPMVKTEQQRHYEEAYRSADSDFGMPDPKIADGHGLRGKRILVLGCGSGNDVWYLAGDNELHGMDYANSGLEVATRHGIQVHVGDLNACPLLPFADQEFDLVVCKDILEHIMDPLTVLKEARRVLREDGNIVVSVPNHFAFFMRVRMLMGKGLIYRSFLNDHSSAYDEWDYMHIRFFTYSGFRRFLAAAGVKAE
jgi:2-polyprenyl-3-methyl-5-hydroxy-6-metoxy-1,4-benzoquinol methylase